MRGDGALVTSDAYLDARNLALAEGRVTAFRAAEGTGSVRYEAPIGLIRIDAVAARQLTPWIYGDSP
jgi:hypothetical protein